MAPAVIAIGADLYTPYGIDLYGEDDRVMTHIELEEKIVKGDEKVVNAQSLVDDPMCRLQKRRQRELLQQNMLQ